MEHVHKKEKDDENSIHAEKLKRQQVLSTILKKTPKKRKNAKKEEAKNSKSNNSERKCPLTCQKY